MAVLVLLSRYQDALCAYTKPGASRNSLPMASCMRGEAPAGFSVV